jgi:hypothetical protein
MKKVKTKISGIISYEKPKGEVDGIKGDINFYPNEKEFDSFIESFDYVFNELRNKVLKKLEDIGMNTAGNEPYEIDLTLTFEKSLKIVIKKEL